MGDSNEEVHPAPHGTEPPDDASSARLAEVIGADALGTAETVVLLRVLAAPAPETVAMTAARAKAEELFGPIPPREA